jgi:hypothetical protein
VQAQNLDPVRIPPCRDAGMWEIYLQASAQQIGRRLVLLVEVGIAMDLHARATQS